MMLEAQQTGPQTQLQSGLQGGFPGTEPAIPKGQEVRSLASRLYAQDPDWVTFFREVLGVSGIIRRNFSDAQALADFEKTEDYGEIQQMLAKLRERGRAQATEQEPTRVITVRMPKSLHESLRVEAHERHTSMNKLCISKLLQMIDEGLVPNEV
ncbi:MAG: toxin-antitoxin system HicB family antitoxin [Planctomycetales bacterium]|nr:toxin-antitoxin system HicB family antitoxin [Planctomycetales bacterium]NIM10236.1 toxin-antitoxin system HicB family antitoxin [Planctomycetales bacterium]NIN09650.1 toxin-antitoxin system HicB family antitoxin [Planctomycetales bacterium]NIN78769.1 toxin-antitoxin system HicB family antitoxin [Planctomycetales bacterium]NIO35947.1 toxin-antitoxin system HicB family antitoxin [Planctomycetales bacterium]